MTWWSASLLTSKWLCAGAAVVLVLMSQSVGTESPVGTNGWVSAYSDRESAGEENREFVEGSSKQDRSWGQQEQFSQRGRVSQSQVSSHFSQTGTCMPIQMQPAEWWQRRENQETNVLPSVWTWGATQAVKHLITHRCQNQARTSTIRLFVSLQPRPPSRHAHSYPFQIIRMPCSLTSLSQAPLGLKRFINMDVGEMGQTGGGL